MTERDPLSPAALQEAEANLRNWLGTGGVFGESAEQFIVRHRDAVLSAERARLLGLTSEQVVEAAAKAMRDVILAGDPTKWEDLGREVRADYWGAAVRAALPVLLAPERARREQAERERLVGLMEEQVVEEAYFPTRDAIGEALRAELDRIQSAKNPRNLSGIECSHLAHAAIKAAAPILLAPERAKREAAEREVDRLAQYHGGHLPTCGGMDSAEGRCDCGYLQGEAYRDLYDRLATAEAERDRLREALEKYGDHRAECAWWESHELSRDEGPCNCGLRAALGGAK